MFNNEITGFQLNENERHVDDNFSLSVALMWCIVVWMECNRNSRIKQLRRIALLRKREKKVLLVFGENWVDGC